MAIDAGRVVAVLELDTGQFSGGLKTARSLIKTLRDDSLSASAKISAVGEAIRSTGKVLSTSLTLPIVAAGTAATKTFTDFDDAMRQVQATMGLTGENGAGDIVKLTEAAKEMGATTRYTASQAAEALNYLALAGYNADKAIAALPSALRLAQAGNIDLGRATDMVTDSMSALGIATNQLSAFVDEMAKTSQKSNTNIAQLGEGILTVGGTAKSLKGGTVELNTALGILADNGIKGAEGGTALRNMLLTLQTPVDKAAKAMKQYGLNVYDANGEMRGLNEIFADLDDIMEGWTQQKRDKLIGTLFNREDMRAAEALLANYGERWNELSGYISDAQGTAEQMAQTMEGGIGGSFRNLSSAVEGLAIEFGKNLAPSVQGVADWVTELARGFTALPEATQTNIVSIAAWTAAVGPALLIGGKLVSMLGSLAAVMSGPTGWIVLGVAGIAALTAGIDAMGRSVDTVGNTVNRAFERLDKQRVSEIAGKIQAAVSVEVTGGETGLQEQIDAQYQAIIDKLKTGGIVTAEDAGAVNERVNNLIDTAMAGVDITANTRIAQLQAQLDSGIIDAAAYKEQCDQIIADAEAAKLGLEEVRIQSQTTIDSLIGDAGTTATDAAAALDKISEAADEVVNSVNGIGDMITIGSLYEVIREKLTDGKKDTEEQTQELSQIIEDWVAGEKAKIEKAVNGQIESLDINSADYSQQVAAIQSEGAAMMAALDEVQQQSVDWLIYNSGRATSAVEADMARLDEIERRAMEVSARISQATEAEKTVQQKNIERVKRGDVRDEGTITQTVGTVYSDYKEQKADIEMRRQQAVDALNASDLTGDAYRKAAQAIEEQYAAENRNLLAAYQQNLSELLAGIAAAYPEFSKKITDAYEKMDLAQLAEDLIAQIHSGEVTMPEADLSKLAEGLGITPDALNKSISQAFALEDPTIVTNPIVGLMDQWNREASEALKSGGSADFGMLSELLAGMIEAGMFEDLDGLDMTDGEVKLAAMVGDLGEAISEEEVPVTPTFTVTPQVDAGQTSVAVEQAVQEVTAQPVTAAVDVTVEGGEVDASQVGTAVQNAVSGGTITAETSISTNTAAAGADAGAEYAQGLEETSSEASRAGARVAGAAAKALDEEAGAARAAGANIGEGFAGGIDSKMGTVIARAAALARAAINAINSTAEIASPSKASRRSGRFVGEGFGQGLLDRIPYILDASQRAGAAGLAGFNMAPANLPMNHSAQNGGRSAAATGAASQSITLNVNNPAVRSDQDIRKLAREINRYSNHLKFGMGGR